MTATRRAPFTPVADGLIVTIRLTPRGGRDALDGLDTLSDGTTVLKVRVRAAPSEGEANAALLAVLAKALRTPGRDLSLVSGETARVKRVKIEGDPDTLVAAFGRLLGASAA